MVAFACPDWGYNSLILFENPFVHDEERLEFSEFVEIDGIFI